MGAGPPFRRARWARGPSWTASMARRLSPADLELLHRLEELCGKRRWPSCSRTRSSRQGRCALPASIELADGAVRPLCGGACGGPLHFSVAVS